MSNELPAARFDREVEGGYQISTDPSHLDVDAIHAFLVSSYWSTGIPRDVVERSIAGSLCFGVYLQGEQVGFARVIGDAATFAYVGDVYILEPHRGRGLSKLLMKAVMEHPDLEGLRRIQLATRDAHGLYRAFGFGSLSAPEQLMEIRRPNLYQRSGGAEEIIAPE